MASNPRLDLLKLDALKATYTGRYGDTVLGVPGLEDTLPLWDVYGGLKASDYDPSTFFLSADIGIYSPTGMVVSFAGSTAPTGWLLCYGQNVSRTTYADLFAVISTTYGSGDGSTTFTLPDLRGRVVAGQDDMGGSSANRLTGLSGGIDGDVLGGTGGDESHALTEAQLASHDHSVDPPSTASGTESADHTHTVSGNTGTVSAWHTHTYNRGSNNGRASGGGAVQNNDFSGPSSNTSNPSANHTHSFSDVSTGRSAAHTHTTNIAAFNSATAGSGSAHNNVQPTIILNYIIKT